MWWKFFTAVRTGQHKVSPMAWLSLGAAVLYTLSPVDLIPELILGPFGLADDLGLWAIMLTLVTREKQKWEAHVAPDGIIIDAEPVYGR
ncbi:YkvA family protein [Demequina aurantiaca]|uniref:YkvA family protein n=1 Tax=Demequina aurantiaca TaxID=676200 RepID=UPI003D3355DC